MGSITEIFDYDCMDSDDEELPKERPIKKEKLKEPKVKKLNIEENIGHNDKKSFENEKTNREKTLDILEEVENVYKNHSPQTNLSSN